MCRTFRNFAMWLAAAICIPQTAMAQTPMDASADQPTWDVNVAAGFFQGRPSDNTRGWDDWYSAGRYAASIGLSRAKPFTTITMLAGAGVEF